MRRDSEGERQRRRRGTECAREIERTAENDTIAHSSLAAVSTLPDWKTMSSPWGWLDIIGIGTC